MVRDSVNIAMSRGNWLPSDVVLLLLLGSVVMGSSIEYIQAIDSVQLTRNTDSRVAETSSGSLLCRDVTATLCFL